MLDAEWPPHPPLPPQVLREGEKVRVQHSGKKLQIKRGFYPGPKAQREGGTERREAMHAWLEEEHCRQHGAYLPFSGAVAVGSVCGAMFEWSDWAHSVGLF